MRGGCRGVEAAAAPAQPAVRHREEIRSRTRDAASSAPSDAVSSTGRGYDQRSCSRRATYSHLGATGLGTAGARISTRRLCSAVSERTTSISRIGPRAAAVRHAARVTGSGDAQPAET